MQYSCKSCNRNFGENKIKYDYHVTTNSHKRKDVKKQSDMSPTDYLVDMVNTLKQQISDLSNGGAAKRTTSPYDWNNIIQNKLYTIDQIIERKNTNLLLPKTSWSKFISSSAKHNNKQKYISTKYLPLETAANLLISKFYDTPQELLPIVVLNNEKGKNKKIAYYESGTHFNIKTDIKKSRNVELYARIDMFLCQSFSQPWLEEKLKEIYRSLPIEIRHKMHYSSVNPDNISFLDFNCTCTNNIHTKCYRDLIYEDEMNKVWRYKNRELKNIDGGIFKLSDDEYQEFVQDFVDHIENHDYGYVYNEYRENRDAVCFDKESEDRRYAVVDEVYNLITERCFFKKV